jgi:phosphoglycolate phosphatase-like HAD superfamily hydrolase
VSLLVLWDIDGTLLLGATELHRDAIHHGIREVYGVDPEAVKIRPAGRTDLEIGRMLLVGAGVDAREIELRFADFRRAAVEYYGRHVEDDLHATVAPGLKPALERLHAHADVVQALVTGNFEAIARMKLKAAGIGHLFAPHQGGFGSDAEDRLDLPRIARRRAGADGTPWPRADTVIVGDTPRDIACAQADEVRCIAVASGPHGADELRDADEVVDGAAQAAELLESWL